MDDGNYEDALLSHLRVARVYALRRLGDADAAERVLTLAVRNALAAARAGRPVANPRARLLREVARLTAPGA